MRPGPPFREENQDPRLRLTVLLLPIHKIIIWILGNLAGLTRADSYFCGVNFPVEREVPEFLDPEFLVVGVLTK